MKGTIKTLAVAAALLFGMASFSALAADNSAAPPDGWSSAQSTCAASAASDGWDDAKFDGWSAFRDGFDSLLDGWDNVVDGWDSLRDGFDPAKSQSPASAKKDGWDC